MRSALPLVALLVAAPAVARAQHVIAAPGEPGYDAALDAKAAAYDLELHALSTVPVGWGLEAYVHDAAARAVVTTYLTSGTTQDFQTATGMHPYAVVSSYGEAGDMGMFGGVGAAGDCFRYIALRDEHADAALVATAHTRVEKILDGLHWYIAVTGAPGVTARGLMRITPEAGEPPLPDPAPATGPITTPGWHDDQSGMYPFLVWLDDTSKDQLDGYIMAIGAAYDAIHGDTSFDPTLETRLAADARAVAHMLMTPVMLPSGRMLDLVIVDADGMPTGASDINAQLLETAYLPRPLNGFNAWMALGMFRTLYAITGDADIGTYYYSELVGHRAYYDVAATTLQSQYLGFATNYSNVNMAFVAAYGVLRYENDPALAARARDILQNQLYAPGLDRQAKSLQQFFFDWLYAGFRPGGTSDADGMLALADGLVTARAFPTPPFWDVAVTNCDASEIASLSCTGNDGTPLPLAGMVGHNMELVAVPPVPFAIRPPSDFEWRSDPHRVNGGGSDLLMSGQDWQCGYWMARMLATSADGMASVSTNARAALPVPLPDAGVPMPDMGTAPDAGTPPPSDMGASDAGTTHASSGCCSVGGVGDARGALLVAAALAAVSCVRRRRRS